MRTLLSYRFDFNNNYAYITSADIDGSNEHTVEFVDFLRENSDNSTKTFVGITSHGKKIVLFETFSRYLDAMLGNQEFLGILAHTVAWELATSTTFEELDKASPQSYVARKILNNWTKSGMSLDTSTFDWLVGQIRFLDNRVFAPVDDAFDKRDEQELAKNTRKEKVDSVLNAVENSVESTKTFMNNVHSRIKDFASTVSTQIDSDEKLQENDFCNCHLCDEERDWNESTTESVSTKNTDTQENDVAKDNKELFNPAVELRGIAKAKKKTQRAIISLPKSARENIGRIFVTDDEWKFLAELEKPAKDDYSMFPEYIASFLNNLKRKNIYPNATNNEEVMAYSLWLYEVLINPDSPHDQKVATVRKYLKFILSSNGYTL